MSDYLPPDGMTLEAAHASLLGHLDAVERPAREIDRTFYDTFDGLLHAGNLSVVREGGRLALIEPGSGAERAGMTSTEPAQPVLAVELAPGLLRDALLSVIDVRALLPLVQVRSHVRPIDVLDDEGKTVVRMRLEEPALFSFNGRHTALRPRLTLAVVRGYDKALTRVRDTLEHELGFRPADQRLVDEAVRAAGRAPAGTSSKIDVALSVEQRADVATAAVLRGLLEVMKANVEGTIADIDSEFLHDYRVAVRRSRAVQKELKGVFPPGGLARFRKEFRWLQAITGDARDLDVYVLEFDQYRALVPEAMRGDLDPLLGVLREKRLVAREKMVRALQSDRADRLYAQWASFLGALESAPREDRPDAARPIGEVSGERIAKVYERMVKMGDAIDGSSPPEDYHDLRKQGKELRYLIELFGAPLYPSEVIKPMVKSLKALQDALGRHQDREVQVATLRSLSDEVSGLPGGTPALMAMGVLVEHLGADERAARAEFAQHFAEFASESQRELVKETFESSRVLATYNVKGGVGKTSAAVNLAYLAARGGSRTLLWDLDPQAASTYLFRIKPKVRGGGRDLVRLKTDVDDVIKGTDYEQLDLLPADFSYRHMDLALDSTKRPTSRLAKVIKPLRDEYDWIFLDCPPSISLVSESVFDAADALLVPIIPATLSSRTFEQLTKLVQGGPQVLAFFSMVDGRKTLHREVMEELRSNSSSLLDAWIPASADVERMGARRTVIAEFAPRSRAALAYEALWDEVGRRLGDG